MGLIELIWRKRPEAPQEVAHVLETVAAHGCRLTADGNRQIKQAQSADYLRMVIAAWADVGSYRSFAEREKTGDMVTGVGDLLDSCMFSDPALLREVVKIVPSMRQVLTDQSALHTARYATAQLAYQIHFAAIGLVPELCEAVRDHGDPPMQIVARGALRRMVQEWEKGTPVYQRAVSSGLANLEYLQMAKDAPENSLLPRTPDTRLFRNYVPFVGVATHPRDDDGEANALQK